MSEHEGHRGRLIPTDLNPFVLMEEVGFEPYEGEPLHVSFNDCFYKGEYTMLRGVVYKVYDNKYDDAERFEATLNSDGSIEYDVYYYNGSCCFDEALEAALYKAKGE